MIAGTTGVALIAGKIFGATAPIAIERVVATTIASVRGWRHFAGRAPGLLSVIGTAAETGADPDMQSRARWRGECTSRRIAA
jgi:hypothetical protein